MDADTIVADARKIRDERFSRRDALLKERKNERYNTTFVEVPQAYRKTAHQHDSSVIEDEGRQIGTLIYAEPVPHIPPPQPEDTPATTVIEKFLMAWFAESEAQFGPIWWQETLAQVHDNIAWEYVGWRRKPYAGQPKPPDTIDMEEGAALAAQTDWSMKNDRYKREAGVASYCERRFVPTPTAYPVGNIFNPSRFYEIKQVPERDMMAAYGITKDAQGEYSKKTEDPTTLPSGQALDTASSETMVTVVEFWDRKECKIVVEQTKPKYLNGKTVKGGLLVEEWEHNWGRVPYFARPAFVTDQQDEDRRFSGPLDGVYAEMPTHKRLRTMMYSVAYQTAFSPLQIVTKESGDQILDDSGTPLVFLDLEPGKARQMAPGQLISQIPQSSEIAILAQEVAASQARIEHYSLSPVAKGVSPGADTANSALSNLHRFQLSTLQPMAQMASTQASAIYKFVLERISEMNERVFVFDKKADAYLSLSAEEIVSFNVQAAVIPDKGQFKLLVEKHAVELWQARAISKVDMYEMMGYENPEEKAQSVEIEDYAMSLKPVLLQQVTQALGLLDATNRMIQANAQTGSAKNAIPGIMADVGTMQEDQVSGMGKGSPDQPRSPGVRSPVADVNTQRAESGGY